MYRSVQEGTVVQKMLRSVFLFSFFLPFFLLSFLFFKLSNNGENIHKDFIYVIFSLRLNRSKADKDYKQNSYNASTICIFARFAFCFVCNLK